MIRYYCDRCESEVKWSSDLSLITLPIVNNDYRFKSGKEMNLCGECIKNIREYASNILKIVVDKIDYENFRQFYENTRIKPGEDPL